MQENEVQRQQYLRMTETPVGKLLVSLSIPTVISMMVTNIYNIADTAFVGMLGTSESGATGIVFGFMSILQAVAFMCGQGAGSIMSRFLGAKKLKEAEVYAATGFGMSFGIGTLMGAGTLAFMTPLLRLLGSTETIAPFARIYITYIALAAPFFTSSLTLNNLLRYEGKAKLGTVGMMTGAVLNIGIDALLMLGFGMGIAGAGIATAVSQLVSFTILISMYLRGRTQVPLKLTQFGRIPSSVSNVIGTGFPSLLRQGLTSVSTMLLNTCAGAYGDAAVSAMSCVSRISFFAVAIAVGIGQGFQPVSSYNLGAGKKDRVREAFTKAVIGEEIVMLVLAFPMTVFAPELIRCLRNDTEVISIGARALRLMALAGLFIPLTMMVEMGFQSMGEKLLASFSSSLRSGVILIPVLLILSQWRGLAGVQEAQPAAYVLTFFAAIWLCRVYIGKLKNATCYHPPK